MGDNAYPYPGALSLRMLRRRHRTRCFDPIDLPEGHQIVLGLILDMDEGEGVTWDRLRDAAAEMGIGERELGIILDGKPTRGGA